MAVTVVIPEGKIFRLEGPATVRVGPNQNMPTIDDVPIEPPPEPEPEPERAA